MQGMDRNGARAGARIRNRLLDMKMGTLNIATVKGKEDEVVEVMSERNLDIMGLGETRSQGEGERVLRNNYRMYYKGREKDTRHGVAIVLNEEISKYVEKSYFVNERIIGIIMNMKIVSRPGLYHKPVM